MLSLLDDFKAVLKNAEHPLHQLALRFHKYTQQLYSTASGQEWFSALCAFGAHPMMQAPISDPVLSAHAHGRSEMSAFLLRLAADTEIPLITPPQTTQNNGIKPAESKPAESKPEPAVRKARGRKTKPSA